MIEELRARYGEQNRLLLDTLGYQAFREEYLAFRRSPRQGPEGASANPLESME